MKLLKIIQYVVSLIHLILQSFYFMNWSARMQVLSNLSKKIDVPMMTNASQSVNYESFLYLAFAIITLAFYVTISNHLALWITENKVEETKQIQAQG